jgi:hypothetical protein
MVESMPGWGQDVRLWRKIVRTGRVAQAGTVASGRRLATGGRHTDGVGTAEARDAGSCSGCKIETGGASGPVYDADRYGARLVASPRHADALPVTGPVARNMAERSRRTYRAAPGAQGRNRGG